ncbi:MAG: type I 3-dehydroquinate dehydratase [Clostridia bacterium]|nr:type I 3-dehydroquinate dehydratase [Clostridia bacterium]
MKKPSFLNHEEPLLTCMVQGSEPNRIEELVRYSIPEGADALGMQFCKLESTHRTPKTYKRLFASTQGRPVYVTNYRGHKNEGKTDEVLADELVELAECSATLCDMMGDYFDAQPGEFTTDPVAVQKQKDLADRLHRAGAEVLISSHVHKFIPAEQVLEIALGHQERGADISKIVVKANTMEEQLENLRIIHLLKEHLSIPFLLLCGGECHLLRRIGGELGCCMYLCVHEYDEYTTPVQPLLSDMRVIRNYLKKSRKDV